MEMEEAVEASLSDSVEESSSDNTTTTLIDLPDCIILKVLAYLNKYNDVGRVAQTCWRLNDVSRDEILWRNLFHRHFRLQAGLFPGPSYTSSWRSEFRRLVDETPSVEVQVLNKHTDQVLHVSFSHDGTRFATSAKDGHIVVWKSGHPVTLEYSKNMKYFSWKYTQYSQFNESDTLLLVSGVLFGHNSTSGEICVLSLKDGFQLQCRVSSKPYDIFGTWYSDMFFLSGQHQWLNNMVSKSVIWINKASQESQSEHVAVMNEMYRFYNPKASSVRSLIIANCVDSSAEGESCSVAAAATTAQNGRPQTTDELEPLVSESPRTGNPLSRLQREPGQPNFMQMNATATFIPHGPFNTWIPRENVSNITYSEAFRNTERAKSSETGGAGPSGSGRNNLSTPTPSASMDASNSSSMEDLLSGGGDEGDMDDLDQASASSPDDDKNRRGASAEEDYVLDAREKLLIFTCSSETYTPHRIGFKRIPPMTFKGRIDRGPSLAERIEEYKRRKQQEIDGVEDPENDINWANYEAVAHRFDKIDHVVDLHGHIIGMALSPDHRYLYVNSRPWPGGYKISNPLEPPPISSDIDIHVIDLKTITQVGTMRRAHRAHTPNEECFFIFLDVCDKFVASGAEDKHGYIWDICYGISLIKLPHSDVVNSVAFNPTNSDMLVSVSDDFSIKIWRSKGQCRQLGLDIAEMKQGTTLYNLRRQRHAASVS